MRSQNLFSYSNQNSKEKNLRKNRTWLSRLKGRGYATQIDKRSSQMEIIECARQDMVACVLYALMEMMVCVVEACLVRQHMLFMCKWPLLEIHQ